MIATSSSRRAAERLVRLVRPALLAGFALVSSCDDPFQVKPQFENATQPFSVHALSGSPLTFVTALNLPAKAVTRVDGSFSFDVAFDLDAQGDVVLLPVNVVGQNPLGTRRVGIAKPGVVYENVAEAPRSGYVVDSVTVIKRGETAVVQAQQGGCSLSLSPYLHAKIVVDSIDLAARVMYGRTMINLNCGFRSLAPGLPAF